jgi:hypothetical protein
MMHHITGSNFVARTLSFSRDVSTSSFLLTFLALRCLFKLASRPSQMRGLPLQGGGNE